MCTPVDRCVFEATVVCVEQLVLVIEDAVAVVGGQFLGVTVGDGEGKGVGQIGWGELSCGHGLVVFEQGGSGIDKGDVTCSGVLAVPAVAEINIIDVPLVGIAENAVFVDIVKTAQIAETESESRLEVLGVEQWYVHELPV